MQAIGLAGGGGTGGGTDITGGSSADTKGSWTTLGTATADFTSIMLRIHECGSNNQDNLISVRVGGSTVLLEDYLYTNDHDTAAIGHPIFIPAGGSNTDTVQIQLQTDGSNDTVEVSALLLDDMDFNGDDSGGDTYGADTGNTKGTSLDPGATADTESSAVELTTSGGLDRDTDWLLFSLGSENDNITGVVNWQVRIYHDSSGSTFSGIHFNVMTTAIHDNKVLPPSFGIPVDRTVFASGVRVWATVECDVASAVLEITMHGWQTSKKGGGGMQFVTSTR